MKDLKVMEGGLSFGKWYPASIRLLLMVAWLIASFAKGEGVSFTVSSSELPSWEEMRKEFKVDASKPSKKEGEQMRQTYQSLDLIQRLKWWAVVGYLKKLLGPRFLKYASYITFDFGEKYVLEYRISKSKDKKDKEHVTLHGLLDDESLKRWLRRFELSTQEQSGSGLSPVLIVSSDHASLRASDTASAIRRGPAAFLAQELKKFFAGIHTVLTPLSGYHLAVSTPPQGEAEVRAFAEALSGRGYQSAVWIHFSHCQSCSGSRVDFVFYYFPQVRIVTGKSEDLGFDFKIDTVPERFKSRLKQVVDEFISEINDFIEAGDFFSRIHVLVIEGIASFKEFKELDAILSKSDDISKAILKRAEPFLLEYEVRSSLPIENLLERLQNMSIAGGKLRGSVLDQQIRLKFVKGD